MVQHVLYTAGYAGLDQDRFLAKLRDNHVEVLVDVRDRPFSRNRHFNQRHLQAFLDANGIEYISYRTLGVPADLRRGQRSNGDLDRYFDAYRSHLSGQQDVMNELVELMGRKVCCLICLERDPMECHRSVLAEVLNDQGEHRIKIQHL